MCPWEISFLDFCSGVLNNNGYFSKLMAHFPSGSVKGHMCNCLPPAVTDIERLKEKLCDLRAPVSQEQILHTSSFIITLVHCPSLCTTGRKNDFWGSSPAVTGSIWGSSFLSLQIPIKTKSYNFHELLLPYRGVLLSRAQGQHVPVQIHLEE